MRMLGCVLLVGAGLVLAGCGGNRAAKDGSGKGTSGAKAPPGPVNDPEKNIVGTWKMVKADEATATVPVGGELEFTKDGKYRIMGGKGGKGVTEGTYKIEGSKAEGYTLVTTIQVGAAPNTARFPILKLTDKDLVRRAPSGDEEELAKVK